MDPKFTLQKITFNAKEKRDPVKKCGFYKIACAFCTAIYAGQT